jgi:hypothetical protein
MQDAGEFDLCSVANLNAPPCSVLALNPGLNCAKLAPGQLVCTGTGGAPTATCGNRCVD